MPGYRNRIHWFHGYIGVLLLYLNHKYAHFLFSMHIATFHKQYWQATKIDQFFSILAKFDII